MEGLTATPSVERKRLSRSSYNWPFDKRLPPRQPLPSQLIRTLGLEYIDDVSVALADQEARPVRAYDGVVSWQGRSRDVKVLDMGSEPLLGMALLLDNRLTVSCRPNGAVVIEEEEP